MFECTLVNGELFKKIVAALSDLVEQGNFMVDRNMISFQGMDSSHVSLVALQLRESGFDPYRCDEEMVLGVQFQALNKILKCMTAKDKLSMQAQRDGDTISFIFDAPDGKRVSNFDLKLNDIDAEQLGIPETDYSTTVKMHSSEFQRICRDLSAIGDTVTVAATKSGVKFSVNGDLGAGDITVKGRLVAAPQKEDEEDEEKKKNEDSADGVKVKPEPNQEAETQMDVDNDQEMQETDTPGGDEQKPEKESEPEEEEDEDDEDDDEDEDLDFEMEDKKKKKKKNKKKKKKKGKKKKQEGNIDDDLEEGCLITLEETVIQTFSLKYLNNFTKATGLCGYVMLRMGSEVPLEVEYKIADFGSLRYYLAPKIDEDE